MTKLTLFLSLLLLALPQGAQGQNTPQATTLAQGDSLLMEDHDAREALARYREVLAQDSLHVDALWRAARACLVLGILEEVWVARKAWHQEGVEYARKAEAGKPGDPEIIYWRAANLGRWAQEEPGARTVLSLAREVRASADSILRMNPDHAGAQNVLGMYYFEILHLNSVKRALARVLAPSAFQGIQWSDALAHLRRAVALEPFNVLFLKDYGRALLGHGDTLNARIHLERALSQPVVLPTDPIFQREARILLEQAGG